MSVAAPDTDDELLQFQLAYGTPWLGRDRRPQIDDPAVRTALVKALEAYTLIWRKGCTPPDATSPRGVALMLRMSDLVEERLVVVDVGPASLRGDLPGWLGCSIFQATGLSTRVWSGFAISPISPLTS